MRYSRYLARRAAFAVLTVYAVVTAMFFLSTAIVWLRLENRIAAMRAHPNPAPEWKIAIFRSDYVESRNLDHPIYERYVDWLVDVPTLDWGTSFSYNEPVVAVLDGRVGTTLEYVVPGVALAAVLGVVVGLFAALSKDGPFDWVGRLGSYVLLAIPSFMLIIYYDQFGTEFYHLNAKTVAALVVALGLLAGQIRFSRSSALEQTGKAFVKMLRAKGAGRLRMAGHVLRNAALPIVSLSLTELLAVLMLNAYVVEEVLSIDGLATANLRAVQESDLPLVVWSALVFVFVGVLANFLQHVLYGRLDPRVRSE